MLPTHRFARIDVGPLLFCATSLLSLMNDFVGGPNRHRVDPAIARAMHRRQVARSVEILLAFAAFGLAAITAFEAYRSIEQARITNDWIVKNASVGFLVLLLEGSVVALGLRLAFPRMRPAGRLIAPSGVIGYAVVCVSLFSVAWLRDRHFPVQAWPVLGGCVLGLAAFLLPRHER